MKKKVAISVGDLNGIGIQLALENHHTIAKVVEPLYCIDRAMLEQAAQKLSLPIPADFQTLENIAPYFEIKAGTVSASSGAYAYASFAKAVELARQNKVAAISTLPIHKKAWELAGVTYKGHTDALRAMFDAKAIMMLGSPKMYVALFTEHIPLKDVAASIDEKKLTQFFIDFYHTAKPAKQVAVLGLNPHAGDDGVLGDEETIIQKAIDNAHVILGKEIFTSPLVPDVAFTPRVRAHYTHYIAMYHDQGLAPLKALYFDEGINVSLNLPILRTSVDHGTAFDIAYSGTILSALSYINALKYIAEH
ncbi:MAG TPA: 4-hydroxythreonine-4-phosphate dehydrogenase [Sulfurovum sp.]|jgi:4-hydroxythreonine-4-phosphate dehydrogenase|nr:MAG: 4-hydroxythreonine-4-phosphate dehydrogenase [Sulfurovum sp. 35-42-20]OYY55528.1 MAG: 4-hydroxythreonine-4-phosphate dehydrogenase [Sulfurovum sp. 28-43-6]OYZ25997.1 MAG: 4-hydroxythreonine-4-phosphate dehydrogenase [Sulfurovum sp. 16-42-52]OYZ49173.1 MAG: 4-hydroxythreonine-4-phosphate dehydrogenase [Sulfurovum sp. 24-42-9]OZA59685.1 MAG: 4-hydroxythreonine-4-phosphate dehydrogenase [Sulfurovum sp. 39-42-12]HQR73897.1 4-hydroxythreonine-4-phosphate dehydrogenase [Sulfurovum sp.]